MNAQAASWCEMDGHADYELFEDFNTGIDAGEIDLDQPLLRKLGVVGLSNPSKAFFAGDREAYEQALKAYRVQRQNEALRRLVWKATFTIGGRSRALWACGQVA